MIICFCSNISDKDTKETIIEKVKETEYNCKDCILFKQKKKEKTWQLKT